MIEQDSINCTENARLRAGVVPAAYMQSCDIDYVSKSKYKYELTQLLNSTVEGNVEHYVELWSEVRLLRCDLILLNMFIMEFQSTNIYELISDYMTPQSSQHETQWLDGHQTMIICISV